MHGGEYISWADRGLTKEARSAAQRGEGELLGAPPSPIPPPVAHRSSAGFTRRVRGVVCHARHRVCQQGHAHPPFQRAYRAWDLPSACSTPRAKQKWMHRCMPLQAQSNQRGVWGWKASREWHSSSCHQPCCHGRPPPPPLVAHRLHGGDSGNVSQRRCQAGIVGSTCTGLWGREGATFLNVPEPLRSGVQAE